MVKAMGHRAPKEPGKKMSTFANKTNGQQSRGRAKGHAQEESNAYRTPHLTAEPSATVTQPALGERLNRSDRVQSQLQLQQTLNRSPRVAAQMKLAGMLSANNNRLQTKQAVQRRAGLEEEEIAQRQSSLEDEELIQSKAIPLQREPMTGGDKETLQGKSALISRSVQLVSKPLSTATPPAQAPIQRLKIGKEYIYPTGKNGKALLEKVRLAMIISGLSPHGTTKVFKEVVKEDVKFPSEQDFLTYFVNLGKTEVERVKREKEEGKKKVKGWTRPLKMNRPGWPESYKKVVKKGQDIRHIVRNATLKNAIESERDFQLNKHGEQTATAVMKKIGKAMGLSGNYATSFEWTHEIYKKAYLNLGNLFPGAGAINRVIGLTADKISNIAAALIASQEWATPEKISETFDEVAYIISESSDQMERQAEKMSQDVSQTFLGGFEEFSDNIEDYLIDREDELIKSAITQEQGQEELDEFSMEQDITIGVTEAQIGHELMDIAANFGFDIPDEALQSKEMQQLIFTEVFLSNYTPGNTDELANALAHFMSLKAIMNI